MNPTTKTGSYYVVRFCVVILFAMTAFFYFWPAYRASLNVILDPNEGWNAFYGDAALGRMPLYPSPDKLITNNYPPLSFYVVGAFGHLMGDNIIAGRIISLLSVVIIGILVACIVNQMSGDRLAGVVGGIWFVGTISRFFDGYIGMNDPQFLAHVVMSAACLLFIKACQRKSGYAWPILLMVIAGFFKHNIVTMPFAAMIWLAVHNRRQFWKCAGLATAASALGFALCYLFYGRDFFFNFMTPRIFSWHDGLAALPDLEGSSVALAMWLFVGWVKRSDAWVQFCNLLVAIGLVVFFLQKCGAGVDVNAQFDSVIALSIGVGMAVAWMPQLPLWNRIRPDYARLAVICAVGIRLAISDDNESIQVLTSPAFRKMLADRESAMAAAVKQVRETPGDVDSDAMICYRAGKPFVVDQFNVGQRSLAPEGSKHWLPKDAAQKLVREGRLIEVVPDDLVYLWE